jgi:diguanylate cyclase (GGDEF)-like protein
MFELSGYDIGEVIYKSGKSTIYKASGKDDQKKVLIKLQNNEYPTKEELIAINREYMITNKNYGDKVIKIYDMIYYKNSLAIILEDFGAKPLSGFFTTNKLDLKKKIFIAINIAEALIQIHKQGVIHKDINPANIVWNSETDEIKVIDFGLSTEVSNETVFNSHIFEGTCLYISPEQTGKINRPVDYRSDLYSAGATLYELFTGKPPFDGDELEVIHSHIAKIPVEPKKVRNEIPPIISDIIMKLLSKSAEDRYQTAAGLRYDLKYFQDNFSSREKITGFRIAQKDFSNRFEIPQKLYGRENDCNKLMEMLTGSYSNSMRLLLISGYSGVGKTTIIQEISQDIILHGGRFITGRYEQFERSSPYSAIKSALGMLVKNIVFDARHFDEWKNKLGQALGTNAGILVEFLPELEQILGKQSNVCQMEPIEEKNRFQSAISNFINAFIQNETKLILFLDDLQWSDLSSIDLVEYLLTSSAIQNLIIIGSYRDNEVNDSHPLFSLIETVRKCTGNSDSVYQHNLVTLPESSVNYLIADTLKSVPADTSQLTNFIYQKTKGNPFFTNQLLRTLYENGLFTFSEEHSKWEWDIDEIKNVQISDNVVDFLIHNLKSLPSDTLTVLMLASCIGNIFDTIIIYKICDDVKNIADALKVATKKEYVVPIDNNYKLLDMKDDDYLKSNIQINFKFNHNRIQQAAYSLVPDKDKEVIHYKIGKLLMNICETRINSDRNLFEITNHLNIGKNNIINKSERLALLDLNIKAGKKAKMNLAYDIAKHYFTISKKLLSGDEWHSFPDTLFTISLEYTECCYLSSTLDTILSLCDDTLSLASTAIEKASVYELKAKILDHIGEKRETVIDEVKNGLKLFNIDLPTDPGAIDAQIGAGIGMMKGYLAQNSIEDFVNLPVMHDSEKIMVMKLLFQVGPMAFELYPPLNTVIQLIMFNTAVRYGTVEVSCKNLAECGITLGPILGDYDLAYRFNKTAFLLIDKHKTDTLKASTYFIFGCFISHWKKHYSEGMDYFDLSIKYGIETGDIMHSFWSMVYKLDHLFFIGKNMDEYKLDLEKAEKMLISYKAMFLLPFVFLMKHVVSQFQSAYNAEMENFIHEQIKKESNMTVTFKFGHFNTVINFILGNYETAFKWVEFTEPYTQGGTGLFSIADYTMFSALCYIKMYEETPDGNNGELLKKIDKKIDIMKVWSVSCPENFAHKYYLVAAERARILHDSLEIITGFYKKSLDSINSGEFINMRAVINELIGEFWFSRGEETIGKTFMKEALYYYKYWGATSKITLLETKYPNLSSDVNHTSHLRITKQSGNQDTTRQTSIHSSTINLDIKSILKSTQAISVEIKFDKLLKVLMRTIIENAGAQNGCVILKNVNDNKLYVEAVKCRENEEIKITKSLSVTESNDFCFDIVEYVKRNHEIIVISNASQNYYYKNNDYIKRINAKSILCVPILYQNDLKGIIYLENNLSENVFDNQRIEIIEILSSQIAISIEKAQLYEILEEKVNERTKQLALANSELKELSHHDPLTKLYNRRYVYEYITNISEDFIKTKTELFFNAQKRDLHLDNTVIGMFLLDIDHFKKVNDSYGHAAGDEVLIKITEVLKNIVRSDDFVVRWGGEEFLIILNKTKIEYLEKFSKKVLSKIKETSIELPNKNIINKTCSIGCAYLPFTSHYSDLLTFDQTVNICDFALYQAKENGRNCSVHVSLTKPDNLQDDVLKGYLINLTKGSTVNNDFINLQYIRPDKPLNQD